MKLEKKLNFRDSECRKESKRRGRERTIRGNECRIRGNENRTRENESNTGRSEEGTKWCHKSESTLNASCTRDEKGNASRATGKNGTKSMT